MSTWGSDPTESTYIANHNPQSTFTRSNWNGGMSLRPESVKRGSNVAAIRVGTFPSLRGQYPGTSPRPATSLITPQRKIGCFWYQYLPLFMCRFMQWCLCMLMRVSILTKMYVMHLINLEGGGGASAPSPKSDPA